ncbi:MAG: hypothetical protein WA091_03560 [Minisyncoccales bacterium]
MKRISFNEYNMEHLYDLALGNFQKDCIECHIIKKRIEKFLGDKTIRIIKKQNKKYPYVSR